MIRIRDSARTILILGVLSGLSFLLVGEEAGSPPRPGPSAEVRKIILDRFGASGRINLSASRAVFSPDGVLRLKAPELRAFREGGDLTLQSALGEMSPEYEVLELSDIQGASGGIQPLRFHGSLMRYRIETGELSGGEAHFERNGQTFTAGSFTYTPERGAKFTNGVRGLFTRPAAAN